MNVITDEWTPLFGALESRVNSDGARNLLFQLIGDVYDVTVLNLGDTGIARPEEWAPLTTNYAAEYHDGNRTPTLILSGELRNGFVVDFDESSATLTNTVPYADKHQFGDPIKGLPSRPFYPVDESGMNFTPFMENRLSDIVDKHFSV